MVNDVIQDNNIIGVETHWKLGVVERWQTPIKTTQYLPTEPVSLDGFAIDWIKHFSCKDGREGKVFVRDLPDLLD